MSSSAAISVLMPVYNAGAFLVPALESLAAQHETNFEVVAVDDGSTDGSRDALLTAGRRWKWLRIVIQNRGGVAQALNRAWEESHGALIARMDADDLCTPDRFAKQAAFLRAAPEVGVCGSWFRVIDGRRESRVKVPVDNTRIRARLVFGSAFAHPSVMLRREVVGPSPYDPRAVGMEDYDLWLRLAKRTRFHSLPQELLRYRVHPAQVTQAIDAGRDERFQRLRLRCLEENGMAVNGNEERAHAVIGLVPSGQPVPPSQEVDRWLRRLRTELPAAGWCERAAMHEECGAAWWRFNQRNQFGWTAARQFCRSEFTPRDARSVWRALRLALRRQVPQTVATLAS